MTEPTEPIEAVIARLKTKCDFGVQNDLSVVAVDPFIVSRLLDYVEGVRWRPIESAPRDGTAFLAFGVHGRDAPEGASRQVIAGDHWWGIILWDVWRGAPKFVFAKDGAATWSAPTHWQPLLPPPPLHGKG